MKRLLIIFAAAVISVAANAQVRSVGLTVGAFEGVSFQHMIYGTDNVFQLDLGYQTGVPHSGSMRLVGTYNKMLMSPEWTSEGTWNMYAGPGVQIGTGFVPEKAFSIGVVGVVGLEYIFWVPLQLSVDIRPSLGVMLSDDSFRFDIDGMLGFIPTISARYMF